LKTCIAVAMEGPHLRLLGTDGGAAIGIVYAKLPHQRCWTHKLVTVASYKPQKIQAACLALPRRFIGRRMRGRQASALRPGTRSGSPRLRRP